MTIQHFGIFYRWIPPNNMLFLLTPELHSARDVSFCQGDMVMVRERGLCVAVCYVRARLALICGVRAIYTSVGTRSTMYEQLLLVRQRLLSFL